MNEPKICPLINCECRDIHCTFWDEDCCKCIIESMWDVILETGEVVEELAARV